MPQYVRQNSEIIKGSALMLFVGDNYDPVGFATEHSLEINLETVDISTKDHGDFAAKLPQRFTWTCTASNLYSDEGELFYADLMKTMTPVKVKFAKASQYNAYGQDAEEGIVEVDGATDWTAGTVVAEGKALITNFSMNASAGDNATLSVQFEGVGELTFGTTTP